jgi:hypothetical protein
MPWLWPAWDVDLAGLISRDPFLPESARLPDPGSAMEGAVLAQHDRRHSLGLHHQAVSHPPSRSRISG